MFYVSSFSWTLIGDVAKKAELVISCISWTFGQELSSNVCLLFKFFLEVFDLFPPLFVFFISFLSFREENRTGSCQPRYVGAFWMVYIYINIPL